MYGGGEGFQYEAPEPWQAAKPDKSGMIYTEFGSCNVYDVYGLRSSAEDCCQKLGYTYINTIPGIVEKKDYGVIITMNSIIFLSFCIFWSPILLIIGLSVWAIYLLIKKYIPNKQRNIGA